MINRLLASILSTINAVLAVAIIGAGAIGGASYAEDAGQSTAMGIIVGLIGGIFVAVLVCGLLAVLLDIRASIKDVAHLLRTQEKALRG